MRGPTDYSNWLIKGQVMIGAYPGSLDDRVHTHTLASLTRLGIKTFVCLQKELDPQATTLEWRRGLKLRPYQHDLPRIAKQQAHLIPEEYNPHTGFGSGSTGAGGAGTGGGSGGGGGGGSGAVHISSKSVHALGFNMKFIHFPIVDQDVVADNLLAGLIRELLIEIEQGRAIYVHCWGGHGRAGTVASILMGVLFGFPPAVALQLVQCYHDQRVNPQNVQSPQMMSQRLQVKRIINAFQHLVRARRRGFPALFFLLQ